MSSLWQKINHLVPEPQCRTRGNGIIEWSDSRAQPTDAELNAVKQSDIRERKKDSDAEKLGDVRLAIAALAEIIYEERDLHFAFPNIKKFKKAIGARYRSKVE